MEENKKICAECGAEVPADGDFCTRCGSKYSNSPDQENMRSELRKMEEEAEESRINLVLILLVVYAIPATIFGLSSLIFSKQFADMVWSTESARQILIDGGVTFDMLKDYLIATSILVLGGGVLTAASAVLTYKRKKWLIAFICCLTATIFGVTTLFALLVGILVSFMLYRCKNQFED